MSRYPLFALLPFSDHLKETGDGMREHIPLVPRSITMKKLLIILSMTLFAASAAFAASAVDGEALFKGVCAACHGLDGSKSAGGTTPLNELDKDTILKRLQGYADGTFGGEHKAIMQNMAKKHTHEELMAAGTFAATLKRGK
ncbi:MAG: c-type cytochrome [Desulfovibrionaceae bacterium]|nr:c-type cytochrome [Desulfovibrionaceae bacterium]